MPTLKCIPSLWAPKFVQQYKDLKQVSGLYPWKIWQVGEPRPQPLAPLLPRKNPRPWSAEATKNRKSRIG